MELPYISNLQRFSLDDGPGIRTTVFFKGCNLRCAWCHNPECISGGHTLQLLQDACTGCGGCVSACRQGVHHIDQNGRHHLDRSLCVGCGACAYQCTHGALTLIGTRYEPESLLRELLKDRRYYETSGGGVTFSGGEPLLHPDYLVRMLELCRGAGLHTAVDTAGCVPFPVLEWVLPLADLFLYDIKLWTSERHQAATGVPNQLILENLRRLTDAGGAVYLRTPIIPGYNDDLEELGCIARFLADLPARGQVQKIQLLPYHNYGVGKYVSIGLTSGTAQTRPPEDAFLRRALQLYLDLGLPAQIS